MLRRLVSSRRKLKIAEEFFLVGVSWRARWVAVGVFDAQVVVVARCR